MGFPIARLWGTFFGGVQTNVFLTCFLRFFGFPPLGASHSPGVHTCASGWGLPDELMVPVHAAVHMHVSSLGSLVEPAWASMFRHPAVQKYNFQKRSFSRALFLGSVVATAFSDS